MVLRKSVLITIYPETVNGIAQLNLYSLFWNASRKASQEKENEIVWFQ